MPEANNGCRGVSPALGHKDRVTLRFGSVLRIEDGVFEKD